MADEIAAMADKIAATGWCGMIEKNGGQIGSDAWEWMASS
jgi:hypothetical protein